MTTTTTTDPAEPPPVDDSVWYFAYGSNMRSSVMANRGMTPLDKVLVKIPTHVLTFDIFGMPFSEPSMASIAPKSQVTTDTVLRLGPPAELPPIHGIAYLITRADYVALVKSEGGGSAYREIAIEADVLRHDDAAAGHSIGSTLTVYTLEAKYPFRPNATPSQRYMGLLMTGAEEHSLPKDYKDFLADIKAFEPPSSLWTTVGASAFLSFWKPTLRMLVKIMKSNSDANGHCRPWISNLVIKGYSYMWIYHNIFHSHIWGRGDGRTRGSMPWEVVVNKKAL